MQTNLNYEEFKNKYNISLNEQQDMAVQTVDGPVLLLAVPGSGKTTVLVSRLGYMLYGRNISPRNILTVTYTVAATNDMKKRFQTIFGDEYANQLEFKTINAICVKILGYFEKSSGKKLFDTADKQCNEIIKMAFRKFNNGFATENDIHNISTAISYVKNMRLSQDEILKLDVDVDHFPDIYKEYNAQLKKNQLIDFDDQLVFALKILESYPQVLNHFQEIYQYISVDEAQDTSKIQHDIINLLASKNQNLFMVGDEDQSIYGFRAAYPQGLLDFEKIYPGAKILLMETNYRSHQEIVEKADEFIQKNKFRHPKKMNANRLAGGSVKNIELQSRKNQYSYLMKVIENFQESQLKQDSFNKESLAVLYRNNESAIPLIDLLEQKGYSFHLKKTDMVFFSHPIVLDLIDILNFALHPRDAELFMKIYYKIGLNLKKTYAQNMVEDYDGSIDILLLASHVSGMPYYVVNSCKETYAILKGILSETAGVALYRILHSLSYQKFIEDRKMDSSKAEIMQMIANNCGSIESFLKRIDELQAMFAEGVGDFHSNFILSTIHSSKGLEYDRVFLMDMLNTVLPSTSKPGENASKEEQMLYEEERRLFYVAMTRAKNELNIFSFKNDETSSFVKEIFGLQKEKKVYKKDDKIMEDQRHSISLTHGFQDVFDRDKTEELKKDFVVGATVSHKLYGKGRIQKREDQKIEVLFDSGKTMPMALDFVVRKGMLKVLTEDR